MKKFIIKSNENFNNIGEPYRLSAKQKHQTRNM